MNKKIAFVAYETPFAPGGGIAAVLNHLPAALKKVSDLSTYVITPFHRNISKTTEMAPKMDKVSTIRIIYNGSSFPVDILLLSNDVNWVFLKVNEDQDIDIPFFDGCRHPYDVEKQNGDVAPTLLRDSLFFGKAAALAIPTIDSSSSWTLLLQDWETATTSLFANPMAENRFQKPFLTLHNCYDTYVPDETLDKFGIDSSNFPGDTVLQRALPLVHKTVFTVSEQFALDLSKEVLQAQILAPHLKSELKLRLKGVNNGTFTNLTVPNKVLISKKKENYTSFEEWKHQNRNSALKAIKEFKPSEDKPIWGEPDRFSNEDIPWIVMAGRDDSRQKGYDLACSAIEKYLSTSKEACFLFFPIPGEEGLPGINFLQELTNRFPENVIAFPFLFREGYFAIMQGATYGLMPSYYEPFGMANEFYLKGAACIGRATGGILQQVVPYRPVSSFSASVEKRSARWHKHTSNPTGFLFREEDDIPSELDDWQSINSADYDSTGGSPNRLEQRQELVLFQSMAKALTSCLVDAINLYVDQPKTYYQFLSDGIEFISKGFTWKKAAQAYQRYINQ